MNKRLILSLGVLALGGLAVYYFRTKDGAALVTRDSGSSATPPSSKEEEAAQVADRKALIKQHEKLAQGYYNEGNVERWAALRFAHYHPDVPIAITPTGDYGANEAVLTKSFRVKGKKIRSWDNIFDIWLKKKMKGSSFISKNLREKAKAKYNSEGLVVNQNGTLTMQLS